MKSKLKNISEVKGMVNSLPNLGRRFSLCQGFSFDPSGFFSLYFCLYFDFFLLLRILL